MTRCRECDQPARGQGLCGKHYMRLRRTGHTGVRITRDPDAKQNWIEAALASTTDECIDWPWGQHPGGYGQRRINKLTHLIHAYVCERAHGPKPHPAWHAAHHCGRPICCNPKHLAWKSPADNHADKIRHGTVQKGERCPSSVLSDADVLEIRRLCETGGTPQTAIALRFGVTQPTISSINTRKTWSHL